MAASVLLTSNLVAQENKQPVTTVQTCEAKPHKLIGKVAVQQQKTVAITLKGFVLNRKTNKAIAAESYPNLTVYANGAAKNAVINPKTGEYTLELVVNENTKTITIYISNDDFGFSKEFQINTKDKTKILNILINPEEEFYSNKIMGGMGVNYIDDKKNKLS
jgi:lipoprotein-anchoring transpeptidase ErfK/SrfK